MNPGGSAGPYLMSILSKLGSKYNHRELYLSIWMDKRSVNVKCPFVFVSNSQSRFFHSGTHLWADTMKTGFSTPSIIEAPLQPYWSWSTWYSKLLRWYEPTVWWHISVTPIPKCSQLSFTKCTYQKGATKCVLPWWYWHWIEEKQQAFSCPVWVAYMYSEHGLYLGTYRGEFGWVIYHWQCEYMLTSESWGMLLPQIYLLHTLALLHWAGFKPISC